MRIGHGYKEGHISLTVKVTFSLLSSSSRNPRDSSRCFVPIFSCSGIGKPWDNLYCILVVFLLTYTIDYPMIGEFTAPYLVFRNVPREIDRDRVGEFKCQAYGNICICIDNGIEECSKLIYDSVYDGLDRM